MATAKKVSAASKAVEGTVARTPKFAGVAERGILTTADLNAVMAALIVDLGQGNINANVANVVCKAAGNMIASTALQLRYAGSNRPAKKDSLLLA
jgi:hypothetical protein